MLGNTNTLREIATTEYAEKQRIRMYSAYSVVKTSPVSPTSSDDALDLDLRKMTKIYQYPQFELRCFEIVLHLGSMFIRQLCHRFEFEDDLLKTNEVRNVGREQRSAFVFQGQRSLGNVQNALEAQFKFHTLLVNRLKKSAAFLSINFEASTSDFV